MPNSIAAIKTYQELRKLDVREANDYFKKFSEFLKETRVSFSWNCADVERKGEKVIELNDAVTYLTKILADSQAKGTHLIFIGNGGSAAIAAHALEDYANIGGFKTIDFYSPSLLTCMANDYGYENVFSKPCEMFAEPGDTLFAISSSGQSSNILNACKSALAKKCDVITFSGFSSDNPLRKLGRMNFYVPSTHYGFVELAHQTLIHCILDLFVRNKIYEEEIETLG